MKTTCRFMALAASLSTASAVSQGFNYGSTFTNGASKVQSDFEAEFKAAQGLSGAPGGGFTSARLYTTIQGGSTNSPISAIPAAISTKTHLLLGLWASAGDDVFNNEIQALANAIATYGTSFSDLVDGISVGSEDLYRISPTGIENKENPGAAPDTIVKYIEKVRDTIANTVLSQAPVGHVDTWTAWVNSSNSEVATASDWVGVDAYPYFQTTMSNSIANSATLFNEALGQTKAAVGGKPVWVTETGFPVSGKTSNMAVPGLDNARTYWDEVGCPLFGSVPTWWYTLQDSQPDTPSPSFGIVGSTLSSNPLFDISCKKLASASSSSGASSASSASASNSASSAATSGASITSVPTSLGGGSPGASAGPGQLSLETSTVSGDAGKPTGSSESGAPTAGSGSGSNGTVSGTSAPNPSSSLSTVTSGAGATLGPIGIAAAAIVGVALAI